MISFFLLISHIFEYGRYTNRFIFFFTARDFIRHKKDKIAFLCIMWPLLSLVYVMISPQLLIFIY